MTRDDSLPFDKESDFATAAIKWLNSQEKTWFVKYHASGYSSNGIPDLLGHINGKFVAIELKAKGGKTTPLQQVIIDKIFATGGVGVIIHTIEELKWVWSSVDTKIVHD